LAMDISIPEFSEPEIRYSSRMTAFFQFPKSTGRKFGI